MRLRPLLLPTLLSLALAGCRGADHPHAASGHDHGHGHDEAPAEGGAEPWAVTAWGTHFELFPEVDPLVAGQPAEAATHVTVLRDFSPLAEGKVTAILRDGTGAESRFEQATAKRAGIFAVSIVPPSAGEYDLFFEIRGAGLEERIPAGRVRVGPADSPGGLLEGPRPPNGPDAPPDEEGSSFLKEQQWKIPFATAWSREGNLADTVVGPARVRPAAGADLVLTAPVDAIVASSPWPHPGQAVAAGGELFRLLSRSGSGRSLAEIEAELASVEADLALATTRVGRLEELLGVEAASRAEVDRARAEKGSLDGRRAALARDLDGARGRGDARGGLAVTAPWGGRLVDVTVTPGQAVAAGDRLGRIVRPRPVWLELALSPADAAKVGSRLLGASLRPAGEAAPVPLAPSAVRVVSRVPALDPATSRLTLLVEADVDVDRLPVGSGVEVELALPGQRPGIVVPAAALVDDGGTAVVYEQLSGEAFARRAVRVTGRQGDLVLVEGVRAGARVVTTGGADIRRATLLGSGAPEGHVH